MRNAQLHTVELIGWDLDDYAFRPNVVEACKWEEARRYVAARKAHDDVSAFCKEQSAQLRELLDVQLPRLDLRSEMQGLEWSLGVVDLRQLIAFQRRISFGADAPTRRVVDSCDWPVLFELAFPFGKPSKCDVNIENEGNSVSLRSANPNLQFRVAPDSSCLVKTHTGSPFFEVAQYAGRWFLRDGYHRAHNLLLANIFRVPAVVIHARTIEELGAVKPWFFSESILLSSRPPFVTDFLQDILITDYYRPPTIKTLRLVMEESVAIASDYKLQGVQQ